MWRCYTLLAATPALRKGVTLNIMHGLTPQALPPLMIPGTLDSNTFKPNEALQTFFSVQCAHYTSYVKRGSPDYASK